MSKLKTADTEIVNFHPKHLEVAVLREYEKSFIDRLEGAYGKIEALAKSSMDSMTIMVDGRIIACCGFLMLGKGICEVWLIPSIYLKDNASLFCEAMTYLVEMVARNFAIHRMQTTAPDDDLHTRFMEFLKFECEGTMRQFPRPNENHKLWSRLWPLLSQ